MAQTGIISLTIYLLLLAQSNYLQFYGFVPVDDVAWKDKWL